MRKILRTAWISRIFSAAVIALVATTTVSAEVVENPSGRSIWTPFPGDFRFTPGFPDTASRYDSFVFKQHTGDFDVLKVTGRFPHARYFSFNIYDFMVGTDIGALADFEITPDQGSVNPYEVGQERSVTSRDYTVWLVKEGVPVPEHALNVIVLPAVSETFALFTRVYRADQGEDVFGGVLLPTIEALKADMTSGQSPEFGVDLEGIIDAPKLLLNQDLVASYDYLREFSGDDVVFHRLSDAGLYPNAHNEYIVSAMPSNYLNKVAVITFTPPTFEDTSEGDVFEGGKEVRYWSLCIGGVGATTTTNCIRDDQAVLNPDGTVTICIAPLYLKRKIEAAGYNHIRWGAMYKPLVLHRHLLADEGFTSSISSVPVIGKPPAPEDLNQQYFDENRALNYMGEYSPTGTVYTVLEFLWWLREQ